MDSETAKAQTAAAGDVQDTIFAKIVRGDIKTDFVYEDDKVWTYFSFFIATVFFFFFFFFLNPPHQ